MTKVGRLFEEEKEAAVKAAVAEVHKNFVIHMLNEGLSMKEISSLFTELTPEEIRETILNFYGIDIIAITDDMQKKKISREILEALPEWFEIPEGREAYIQDSEGKDFFCAYKADKPVGFLYLKKTGNATLELAVMGVLKEYHRKGVGMALFEKAKKAAAENGYSFIQVKTVQMGMYEDYDITNKFYLSLGFKEFEVFPQLWDEANPCQIYVMSV